MLFALAPILIIGQTLNNYTRSSSVDNYAISEIDSITTTVEATFNTCGDILTYSGKAYLTVQIDDQCWLKENLDIGIMVNLTDVIGSQQSDNGVIEKYCYNNDLNKCDTYDSCII